MQIKPFLMKQRWTNKMGIIFFKCKIITQFHFFSRNTSCILKLKTACGWPGLMFSNMSF